MQKTPLHRMQAQQSQATEEVPLPWRLPEDASSQADPSTLHRGLLHISARCALHSQGLKMQSGLVRGVEGSQVPLILSLGRRLTGLKHLLVFHPDRCLSVAGIRGLPCLLIQRSSGSSLSWTLIPLQASLHENCLHFLEDAAIEDAALETDFFSDSGLCPQLLKCPLIPSLEEAFYSLAFHKDTGRPSRVW